MTLGVLIEELETLRAKLGDDVPTYINYVSNYTPIGYVESDVEHGEHFVAIAADTD